MKKTILIAMICAAALTACAKNENKKSTDTSETTTEVTTVTTTAEETTTSTTSTTTTTTVTTTAEPVTTTVQVTTVPPTESLLATSRDFFDKILNGGSTGDIVFLKSNAGGDSDLKLSTELDDNCKQIVWDYLASHSLKEADIPDDFSMDAFLFAVEINGEGDIPPKLMFSEDKAYMGIIYDNGCYVFYLEDAYQLQPLYDLCL